MLQLIVQSAQVQPPQTPPPNFCVTVYFRGVKKKTRIIEEDNNPTWNETLVWHLGPHPLENDSFLQIFLRDPSHEMTERTFGICNVFLGPLAENPHEPLVLTKLPLVSRTEYPTKTGSPRISPGNGLWGRTDCDWYQSTITLQIIYLPQKIHDSTDSATWQRLGISRKETERKKIMAVSHTLRMPVSSKPQDFQVQVRIFEARRLHGNNIEPVVKMVIGNQEYRTRIKKGNNPFFNEKFFHNFLHQYPSDFLEESISVQVMDSKSKRANSEIGRCKIDIGIIYHSPEHTLMRKWLGLCHPNKPSLGIRGYLKITISVLGVGDQAPVDHGHLHEIGELEKNLFLSATVPIQIATFSFFIYRAEDLHFKTTVVPKCFSHDVMEKMGSMNPMLELEMAGKILKTSPLFNTEKPAWDQTLIFSIQLPCMTNYIRLRVLDWDTKEHNEVIGRANLNITHISSMGTLTKETPSGFLPCFGPSYLILYGEEKALPQSFPDEELEELYQQKYGLCVIFLSSTMMPAFKDLVHFEITIGHYGTLYHYLPWQNSKPAVAVTSMWEDVSHRMNSLNILHVARDRLKANLKALKSIQNPKNPALPRLWKKLLKELVEDCKRPLPDMKKQPNTTILDENLWKLRKLVLQELADEAKNSEHKEMLPTAESWLYRLNSVLPEPQSSIPDVVIWLLCKGQRVAYARVPAHTILFSQAGPFCCGKFCGKVQTLFMQYYKEKIPTTLLDPKEQKGIMAAQVRVFMWLGNILDSNVLARTGYEDIIFYSKTYENQAKYEGKWGQQGLKKYPIFSDASGHQALPKEDFHIAQGWSWQGSWFVEPQRKLLLETNINQNHIVEEVYENQTRDIWERWTPAAIPNTDMIGQPVQSRENMKCPEGWSIKENWNVELNQAVDDEGWEYGIGIPLSGYPKAWTAVEKTYHSWRRRRWVRQRYQNIEEQKYEQKELPALSEEEEGWEYGSFGSKFNPNPQPNSMVRRRCWHRRMVPTEDISVSPIFLLERSLEIEREEEKKRKKSEESDAEEMEKKEEKNKKKDFKKSLMERLQLRIPFISCIIHKPEYYQLFCYIYQARNLMSNHIQTFSEPSIQVVFLHYGQRTRTVETSLVPTWDQTLIFDHILLYEKPQHIEENPPLVTLELWQLNSYGKGSLWGRSMCSPVVYLDLQNRALPPLTRHSISKEPGEEEGEILAAFELILETELAGNQKSPLMSIPWKNGYYTLPRSIQPSLKKTAIEILAWGLRNINKAHSPWLLVECGGETLKTAAIKDYQSNPNFPQAALLLTLFLPKEETYAPPLVLKVIDQQHFGTQMVVGQATVYCLSPYYCDPWAEGYVPPRLPDMPKKKRNFSDYEISQSKSYHTEEEYVHEVDWWSKMLWASGESHNMWDHKKDYYALKVYDCELEAVPGFQGLQDFCQTFNLYHGQKTEDSPVMGEFKGLFRVYPLSENPKQPSPPRQFQNLPKKESSPQKCLVRVYVIRAINLQPKDNNGLCDPYVKLKLGKTVLGSRHHYKPNTVDPIFGKMFELNCTIPLEKDLEISLFDFDLISFDDKIGSTVIDLENRLLSSFGARCGLSKSYCMSGPFQWRDQLTPSHLLERYAQRKGLPPPDFSTEDCIIFNGRIFKLHNFEQHAPPIKNLGSPKERLALYLLEAQGLVPEHVETRTLYCNTQPGIDQGKVQLWVDIFPLDLGPPGPAVNINPRKAKRYELRCIIWDTRNVDLKDISITGEKMSDIYIKGWMHEMEGDTQKTDIHYRSITGDGNFNWRFIFKFNYLPTEQVCILNKKEFIWSLDPTVKKIPPQLIIQIWDNDKFLSDDFLGILELDLSEMPTPAQTPRECTLSMMEDKPNWPLKARHKQISLFRQKIVTGWWPCQVLDEGKWRLSGKVKMTLEVLTKKEAEERPAGRGRSEPNQYPKLYAPIRPETSFLWFLSPWQSMRIIFWKHYRKKFTYIFLMLGLMFLLLSFIYSMPHYLAMKIVKPEFRVVEVQPKIVKIHLKTTTTTTPRSSSA